MSHGVVLSDRRAALKVPAWVESNWSAQTCCCLSFLCVWLMAQHVKERLVVTNNARAHALHSAAVPAEGRSSTPSSLIGQGTTALSWKPKPGAREQLLAATWLLASSCVVRP